MLYVYFFQDGDFEGLGEGYESGEGGGKDPRGMPSSRPGGNTKHVRLNINARERRRMHDLNDAPGWTPVRHPLRPLPVRAQTLQDRNPTPRQELYPNAGQRPGRAAPADHVYESDGACQHGPRSRHRPWTAISCRYVRAILPVLPRGSPARRPARPLQHHRRH